MSLTFCGASVRGYNASGGWNEQSSSITINLVEDPDNGDLFLPPLPGTPIYFQHNKFKFFGLLQTFQRDNDTGGLPTFTVRCNDPREILQGVQLITGAYRGPVEVDNLFNVFGWWENLTGFGSSGSGETGIPWHKVVTALSTMANSLVGIYGRAIKWNNVTYSLDLSELPIPPVYYRIPVPGMSLMEAINMVCEDGGCDYFVDLVGFTIKIRTVSRIFQPPLGTITDLTAVGYGEKLIKSSSGIESKNEVTTSFVIGGQQNTLHMVAPEGIVPFWGFDFEGKPITGTGTALEHSMVLNSSAVADIIGSTTYPCSVLELCTVLANQDTWMSYMSTAKPEWASIIGMPNMVDSTKSLQALFTYDFKQDSNATIESINAGIVNTLNLINTNRMYEFLRQYAQDYMGKKFLVSIPFTLNYFDPDQLRVIPSQEPIDGGFLPEGSTPLGLPLLAQDQFKTQDGRFESFVLFRNLLKMDLSKINVDGSFMGEDGLYVKAQVDKNIVYTPYPAVVVTLSSTLYEMPPDGTVGDIRPLSGILQQTPESLLAMISRGAAGSFPWKIHPVPHQPDFAAVPLQSNILTYGPWFLQGVPGKVNLKLDSSLTPWNYGGYENMQFAGMAMVREAISNMTLAESGNIEHTGEPDYSLGELFQGVGPNITNIDVSYGEKGLTTIYRMQTYTPRFGVVPKSTAERIKKLGLQQAELRKALRASINKVLAQNATVSSAYLGWLHHMPKWLLRQSPSDVIVSHSVADAIDNSKTRSVVSSMTFDEAISTCGAHIPNQWKSTAMMSLSGLIRPFRTDFRNSTDELLPGRTQPDSNLNNVINSDTYNAFQKGNDIEVMAHGSSYKPVLAYKHDIDPSGSRPFALRAPLWLSGWGWCNDGVNVVPGTGNKLISSTFASGYLRRSHIWRSGPVDFLWDELRGVWTVHDLYEGIVIGTDIQPGGSGYIQLLSNDKNIGQPVPVYNFFKGAGASVKVGVRVICGYVAYSDKIRIMAADCQG